VRRHLPRITYTLAVLTASLTGFCSPLWYFGFPPLAAGLLWASLYLIDDGEELTDGDTAPAHRRR
jgi:hypothetical protein